MDHQAIGRNDPDDSTLPKSRGRAFTALPGPTGASLTLTIPQAATLLGISTSAAYEFARKGEVPTLRLGTRVLVSRKRLEEMIDGRDGFASA